MDAETDELILLKQASELTSYCAGYIRNFVYWGKLKRYSPQTDARKSDGIRKRGPRILVSRKEVIEVFGYNPKPEPQEPQAA